METYDEGEHNKTVYAHFGLAIYLAQCFEHGIVNALAILDLIPTRRSLVHSLEEWAVSVDEFMDRHFEHTLGQMIRDLKRAASVPAELEAKLAEALKRRNWLAHDYFRERAENFMTIEGKNEMIAELESAQNLFRDADQQLEAAIKPIRVRYGLTDERLKQCSDEMLAKVCGTRG